MKRPLTVNPDTHKFGVLLTRLMMEADIDDKEMERQSGLSYHTVRALRRLAKPNPTSTSIAKLAAVLKIKPELLAAAAHDGDGGDAIVTVSPSPTSPQLDRSHVLSAMRELEKCPNVAAYRYLAASIAA
jgi:hypothetical protein